MLIDFINRYQREGYSIQEAALESGQARFRPILLTSITTFVSLIPLLLEKSLQAQFLIPMAISLGFGVLFSAPGVPKRPQLPKELSDTAQF